MTEERLRPGSEPEKSWWATYRSRLPGLTPTATRVLEDDCRYLLSNGVLAAGQPGDRRWGGNRVRRGMVMGAVQSGKTGSLLGVTALAMDSGVDVVVVLAGSRVSLWRQTLGRLRDALEPEPDSRLRWAVRPEIASPDGAASEIGSLYAIGIPAAKRALQRGRPLVLVAMKQVDHLRALGRVLRDEVAEAAMRLGRKMHVLVLDDEADDGSILDARAEAGLDPLLAHLKQVPRQIVDLWDVRPHQGLTFSENVYVTYVGYTATPQANLLQSSQNLLAPSDFVVALRTPLDIGQLDPREPTFREPLGPKSYYTGGELFYRRLTSARLCLPLGGQTADEDLADALRAYLVAGAVKDLEASSSPRPPRDLEQVFPTEAEARSAAAEPHSMLIHPSASVASHFEGAARVLAWFGGTSVENAREQLDADGWSLGSDGVLADLVARPERWSRWLDAFRTSASEIASQLAWLTAPTVSQTWADVRAYLVEHFLPAVRLSVINSDPRSDDRAQFEPWHDGVGWRLPRDSSTIFVSGNVMSRGLTLEGLTTTLFLRTAKDPYADTQMQMQRWFGYRGSYLYLCRVFLPPEQLSLFQAYHDVDEALRRDILGAMSSEAPGAVAQVLQGRDFSATGKIANLANQSLHPGLDPFVQLLATPAEVDPNLQRVLELFAEPSSMVGEETRPRGRLLGRELSLFDAATLLDDLRYSGYSPGTGGWFGSHWAGVERQTGIAPADANSPLYRPPGGSALDQFPEHGQCPYLVAAYLRLWDACLSRHARGLFATDQPSMSWSLVDLQLKAAQAPRFRVGLRFGLGEPVREAGAENLPFEVRAMNREICDGRYLKATWGSRNRDGSGGYLGDQSFDLPAGSVDGNRRDPGESGLILFHVVQKPAEHARVAVGVVIPLGGPDHFAARIRTGE